MNEKQKIAITGPMSEVNFGDYAMLINNIYDMRIKNITIFSYNKVFSDRIIKDYCRDFSIKAVEVKLFDIDRDKLLKKQKTEKPRVGFLPFNYPTDTPLDILYRIENLEEIRETLKDIDVLIVNGGGYFNHLWNNSLWRSDMLRKIVAPIIIANQLKKKIIFTGNGFGPFDQSEEFFNYLFNYLNNVTFAVRDRMYSEGYLKRINIDSNKIHFIPDDLYCINDEILKLETNNMLDFDKIGRYLVMEIYYPLEEIKEYILEFKRFSENIYKKYNVSIVFIPFDFQRGGMWQGEYLKKNLENFFLYDINKTGYLPIQDLHKIINNSELVLCTRYHAMVLAIGSGVPVVNMVKKVCDDHRYYFNKNYGLLEYAFEGINFNEMDFLKINFLDTLKYIEDNFMEITEKQKKLYNSYEYNANKERLRQTRMKYLERIKLGD